jgi:hypothetical protein
MARYAVQWEERAGRYDWILKGGMSSGRCPLWWCRNKACMLTMSASFSETRRHDERREREYLVFSNSLFLNSKNITRFQTRSFQKIKKTITDNVYKKLHQIRALQARH